MKLHCVKCGRIVPKDEDAKSLLPFEIYRCRNCGDGMLLNMATKEAYLIPKSLGLFEMTLEKSKKQSNKFPTMKTIRISSAFGSQSPNQGLLEITQVFG